MASTLFYVLCLFIVDVANTMDQDDIAKLSASNLQFSIDFYKTLIADPATENIMFSPVSITAAMAVVHLGAKGQTAKQIEEVFGFNRLEGKFHSTFGELHDQMFNKVQNSTKKISKDSSNLEDDKKQILSDSINVKKTLFDSTAENDTIESPFHQRFDPDKMIDIFEFFVSGDPPSITITSSNRVFANKHVEVLEDYQKALKVYGAQVDLLDFANNPQKSVESINNWISEATESEIPAMLTTDSLNRDTQLVIANALSFRADWHFRFSEENTKPKDFYVTQHKVVKTPFMFREGEFRYGFIEDISLQILELPYANKKYSMYVLLPENFDLKKVEANLNPDNLTRWISQISNTDVEVTIPKFILEESLDLVQVLPKLGVTDLFDGEKADLSGQAKTDIPLFVDQILTKTSFEMNERGSMVTSAVMVGMDYGIPFSYKQFLADHPFLWAIRHQQTGLVLFMGRIQRPDGDLTNHDEF
uniref:Leukocyte elastase inhibitor-like n=1 Tax=Phallusia mammillata TaxID=59560 RepID=A0A6F9DRB1_9ASCI|nr:leukocyte elastase inhibitor-like [Phallusia mammillata]